MQIKLSYASDAHLMESLGDCFYFLDPLPSK